VDQGSFVGLIVAGDLTIRTNVGLNMDGGNCVIPPNTLGNYNQSSLDAFLVARDIKIYNKANDGVNRPLIDPVFNTGTDLRINCDNRLVMYGSFSFWGTDQMYADVEFTRTLRGCGLKRTASRTSIEKEAYCYSENPVIDPVRARDPSSGHANGHYLNRNRDYAATTIIYRPDIIINMPDWMTESTSNRLEVR
jgi:hypothetical protein